MEAAGAGAGAAERSSSASTGTGIVRTSSRDLDILHTQTFTLPSSKDRGRDREKDKNKDDKNNNDRLAREIKPGLHPLQNRFAFWYLRRQQGARTQTSYEENMKKIADFSTVEDFWKYYCHFVRVQHMQCPTNLHLFKEGIRPLWEDPANCNGGKWILRLNKVVSGRYWEDLVLAFIGEQLDCSDNVCGIVLSVRYGEDILSVWNMNASDNHVVMALRDSIKKHLHLPPPYQMEYKPHDAALRDNSSYRNTWIKG